MLPVLTPTDFVALANQTLELAYPFVEIEGEVLNFKVSRGRWIYFDIADEMSKLRCFGTVFMMPGPVEDGMKVKIKCIPKLHPQFGFSLNIKTLQFSGEGSIKKAADLLYDQLNKEGLFSEDRKRILPYPPESIGLITSAESAAYRDFIKILDARWGGISIELANVQVQGETAPGQIVRAIDWFNRSARIPDVLVLIRGGGSADDLQAFSSEQVTRAVAASRIPTVVAIGHETDTSLAELAADMRASTPSNAAELLVPDRREQLERLGLAKSRLDAGVFSALAMQEERIMDDLKILHGLPDRVLEGKLAVLDSLKRTLDALSPGAILKRGYAIVRSEGRAVKEAAVLGTGSRIEIQLSKGKVRAEIK